MPVLIDGGVLGLAGEFEVGVHAAAGLRGVRVGVERRRRRVGRWGVGVYTAGDKPQRYISPSLPLDSGFRRSDELRGRNDQGMPRVTNERLLERAIPVRSPGDAFIAIAHAGWRRHTKV